MTTVSVPRSPVSGTRTRTSPAVIGSVGHLSALLNGEGGTRITTEAAGMRTR